MHTHASLHIYIPKHTNLTLLQGILLLLLLLLLLLHLKQVAVLLFQPLHPLVQDHIT